MRLDFRAVWAASANPYMVLDRELRYVDANPAYLELTGTSLASILGRTVFELFPNNDPSDPNKQAERMLRDSFLRVLRSGKTEVLAHIPYRVPRSKGGDHESRIWSATHTPIFDDAGAVAFILQHTQDVTHLGGVSGNVLARAERVQRINIELDSQVRTMRALFEQAPGFVAFMHGPEHVFEMTNAAYDLVIGGRKVIGKALRDALPELVDQGFCELVDQVYASGEPYVGKAMRFMLESDCATTELFVDFVLQPISDPVRGTIGVFVQGHDMTDAKRAEIRQAFLTRASEHIAHSGDCIEDALRGIAEAAVAAFADAAHVDLFDENTSRRIACVDADPAKAARAQALMQFPIPVELIGAHGLVRGGTKPILLREVTPAMVATNARGPEHFALLEDLGIRSILTLPLWHRDRLYGVFVFAQAGSGRRFGEQDRLAMEDLGRVLGAALDNARFQCERHELLGREHAARERAEAANRAKDDFLAMLGHELRNPLAPILTAVQLMRLRGDEESLREQAVIERQAQHMVRIVDDLLDVSKVARGKIELRKEVIEVSTICTKAVEIIGPMLETKGHQLTIDVPVRGLRVYGDEARLSQVLSNLLSNAIRYTEPDGRIHLSAKHEGNEVVLRVTDSGIGIGADMLPRVFDMFVQATQTSDRPEGGLGLGLTLVRRLVELHDGTVDAASAGLRRGSTFTVRLPAEHRAVTSVTTRKTPVPSSCRNVLVVDDNEDAAMMLADLLRRRGYQVVVANDAESALRSVREVAPEIAVVDIGLPRIDGYELARELRVALGERTPQLIALTGYTQDHDRARSAAAGFQAHLSKPVDSATLLRTIEHVATVH
ncbi:MAG: ATP-binding protein [Kofleriaceae bacterium]|nr:ATP-binding protein [Kofleriaceae bacterium]